MRVWPLVSIVVLAASAGCKGAPAVDHSRARGHADESVSVDDSRPASAHTPEVSIQPKSSPSFGETHGQLASFRGGAPAFAPIASMATLAPVAFMMKTGADLLGAFGFSALMLSFEMSPVPFLTGGTTTGIILGVALGALTLGLRGNSVPDRSGSGEDGEEPPKPKHHHPKTEGPDENDKDPMKAPPLPEK
jgi:hypothetical protein